jgi:hypothetical protein
VTMPYMTHPTQPSEPDHLSPNEMTENDHEPSMRQSRRVFRHCSQEANKTI